MFPCDCRTFIRTPLQGASSALDLLLKEEYNQSTGCISVNNKLKKIPAKYRNHSQRKTLWEETEERVKQFLINK